VAGESSALTVPGNIIPLITSLQATLLANTNSSTSNNTTSTASSSQNNAVVGTVAESGNGNASFSTNKIREGSEVLTNERQRTEAPVISPPESQVSEEKKFHNCLVSFEYAA
jgi:hypothetical protein